MHRLFRYVALAALVGLTWAVVAPATGQDTYTVTPCSISGAGIEGTLITVPLNQGWSVEIDRDGRTLIWVGHDSDHTLARDGEPFRIFDNGELVFSGVGQGFNCDGEETTTTLVEVTTTTRPPLNGCDDIECPPQETTTTTQPDVTTTTRPNEPTDDGVCPPGTTMDPTGVCFADAEGG